MVKKLVVSDGTRERELQLVGRIVVGRDPVCDISQDHSLLSRRHAEFVTADGVVTVRDLGSRNGIFVNGVRAAEHVLEPGDVVQVGPLRARYLAEPAPAAAAVMKVDADSTAVQSRDVLLGRQGEMAQASPVPAVSAPQDPSPALADRGDDELDETKLVPRRDFDGAANGARSAREDEGTWMVSGPEAAAILEAAAPGAERGIARTSAPSDVQPPVDVSAETVLLLAPRAEKPVAPPVISDPPSAIPVGPPAPAKMPDPVEDAAPPSATPSLPSAGTSSPLPLTGAERQSPPAGVDERALKSVVLVHLLVAVAIVAAAGAVPFMILRAFLTGATGAPSLLWLALPVAVGVATAIVLSGRTAHEVATLINAGDRTRGI